MTTKQKEPATLSGSEKAAVLLLSLGPEAASDVMRHLGDDEVRRLVKAVARVRSIDAERLDLVNQEFVESLKTSPILAIDGKQFAKTLLTRTTSLQSADPNQQAAALAELELAVDEDTSLAEALAGVAPAGLASVLEAEHPQVAALILAHLDSQRASQTVARLSESFQVEIVERMARLDTVPAALHREIGSVLASQLQRLSRAPGAQIGGVRAAAGLINRLEGDVQERILATIEERDGSLCERIRALTFTFADCLKIDTRSLQTLLKEVPREDLLYALKITPPELSEKIFSNLSSRAAEIHAEDLA
jgi:flagellar motor switch protein FliG